MKAISSETIKSLKKQNNPWEKLIQTDLVAKSVSITDFLKNWVMRIAFLCIINARLKMFI